LFVKIFVGLILFIVAVFIISQLVPMSIEAIILITVTSFLAIPLYIKCQSKRKGLKKKTFFSMYWYDMQCTIVMIVYGIIIAGLIVKIIK